MPCAEDRALDAGVLRLAVQWNRVGVVDTLVPLKTKRSRRTLPLWPDLVRTLWQHRTRQIEERLCLGSLWHDHDLVFPSEVGTPESSNAWRSLQRLLVRVGLPRMRFHDLRHSCATFVARQGVHMRSAMEILGHSTIATTTDIYQHVLDENRLQAAAQMGALFPHKDIV